MAETQYAVVLAAFGTMREQEENYVERIKEGLQRRHPDTDVFDAFTSRLAAMDRRKKGRTAIILPQVLAELSTLGYTHVVVQSLHVVPGMEFDMLCDITRRFSGIPKGIQHTRTGLPLIHDDSSADRLAAALAVEFSGERHPGEAVVFVGHGAKTLSGTLAYPALQACLWRRDPALFVGTLEGSLCAETILAMLHERGMRKVWLVPLLACCGTHVHRDIFGAENSWRTVFEAGGIQCVPVEKALLARPAVTAMWLENALACLEDLKSAGCIQNFSYVR